MTTRFLRRPLTRLTLAAALTALAQGALAQTPPPPQPQGTIVELSAEASRAAPNDLAVATVFYEANQSEPAKLAEQVNAAIADALQLVKQYPQVKAQTGGVSTYPVYRNDGKGETPTIEAWRMRSSIELESRDIPALSTLLGKLQQTLGVANVSLQPAPATRSAAADEAVEDAIRAFEARAAAIAKTLGKQYRIQRLSISHDSGGRPYPMMRQMAVAASADAVSAPLQGGESDIAVSINGAIELID